MSPQSGQIFVSVEGEPQSAFSPDAVEQRHQLTACDHRSEIRRGILSKCAKVRGFTAYANDDHPALHDRRSPDELRQVATCPSEF